MSQQFVTPFLVLNLGSEMVFVVAQRLQAQNVPLERSAFGMETNEARFRTNKHQHAHVERAKFKLHYFEFVVK